jgi:hypothetical protein
MSHYITFAYPDAPTQEDKFAIKTYFDNLKYILPCENCRGHYSQHLVSTPLTNDILSSRYKLIKWLVDLHNAVNKRTGAKEYTLDEIFTMYSTDDQSNFFNIDPNVLQILFLIVIVICLIIYIKNKSE